MLQPPKPLAPLLGREHVGQLPPSAALCSELCLTSLCHEQGREHDGHIWWRRGVKCSRLSTEKAQLSFCMKAYILTNICYCLLLAFITKTLYCEVGMHIAEQGLQRSSSFFASVPLRHARCVIATANTFMIRILYIIKRII